MLAGALTALGGKTTNGYVPLQGGRKRGYQRLDMTKPQDMEAWLNLSRAMALPGQSLLRSAMPGQAGAHDTHRLSGHASCLRHAEKS